MSSNDILRWVAPALMLVLLSILMRRRLYRRFPVFFTYCWSIIAITVLRFLADGEPTRYFFVYWGTEACYLGIALIAMLSVLRPLTELEYSRHTWSRFVLSPFLLLTIGLASYTAILKPINRTTAGRTASAIYVFVVLMSLAEFVLFIISFKARRRAIVWTQYEFGILTGFGVLTSLNLIAYFPVVLLLFRFNVGQQLQQVFQAFPVGAFMASAVTWIMAFWKPEPLRPEPPDVGSFLDALRVILEQYKAHTEFVRKVAKHLGNRFLAFAN